MHIAGHVLEHSIEDTLYLIPFLFVTYLAMEWLEHKAGDKAQNAIKRAGKAGPVIGAVLGVVPQCGFSAAASTLYAGRVITVGTLIAVLLSTSDEMIPIFLAAQVPLSTMGAILGAKVVVGIVAGLALDGVLRLLHRPEEHLRIHELCQRDHCHCNGECHACEENPELSYEAEKDEEHHHDHAGASIVKSALKHTAQVTVFIFIVTLLLNVVLETVGEDALAQIARLEQRAFGRCGGHRGPHPELRSERRYRRPVCGRRARRGGHVRGPARLGGRRPACPLPSEPPS